MSDYVTLVLAAVAAGAVNALAGGGTLLTFPALTAVVPAVVANGTSTVALLPGSIAGMWGYRREIREVKSWAWLMTLPSLVGGLVGSLLVTLLPPNVFDSLVPWLILGATLLFLFQPVVTRLMRTAHAPWPPTVLVALQLPIAVYGGYFGAGMGILVLASLAFMGLHDIHQMNGVKTVQAVLVNFVAAAEFIRAGVVHWPYAASMMAGASLGGYFGAHYGRRLNRSLVRGIVVGVGLCLSAYYFSQRFGG
jgi:hypothetical protein